MKDVPWLRQAVPESSRDLFVPGEDIVVPEREARYLKREHGIRIEAPITLEEVEERAAEEPQSDYGEALIRWGRRLYTGSKEEFIEKTIGQGWEVIRGPGKKLDEEMKAAAIGCTIVRECTRVWGEINEFL